MPATFCEASPATEPSTKETDIIITGFEKSVARTSILLAKSINPNVAA